MRSEQTILFLGIADSVAEAFVNGVRADFTLTVQRQETHL